MSLSLLNVPGISNLDTKLRWGEIAGFSDLKDADFVVNQLRSMMIPGDGYDVMQFAAGMYYVVLMGPDFTEAKDGTTYKA